MNDEERQYYDQLAKIMLVTRGVRFTAAELEKRKSLHSVIIISILSIYLTIWSICNLVYADAFRDVDTNILGVVSIAASVSLLVISLFDFAADRSVQSERMLRDALSIGPLARALERELASPAANSKKMSSIAHEYELLLVQSGVNHTSADHRLWKVERLVGNNKIENTAYSIIKFLARTFFFAYSAIFQLIIACAVVAATGWIGYRIFF